MGVWELGDWRGGRKTLRGVGAIAETGGPDI